MRNNIRDYLRVLITSLLMYISAYYLGFYTPIIFSWGRVTLPVYVVVPIFSSISIDCLSVVVLATILVFTSLRDSIGRAVFISSTIMLVLTSYLSYLATSVAVYLTLLGVAGAISLFPLYIAGHLRIIKLSIATLLSTLSLVTLVMALLIFINPNETLLKNLILIYWRGFWRAFDLPVMFMLVGMGLYWLILLVTYAVKGLPPYRYECSPSSPNLNRYLLTISLLIPSLLVALLHLPTFNPKLAPISVDTFYYARELSRSKSIMDVLKGFSGTRPLYMVLIYTSYLLIRDPILLMDIIHPALVLTLLTYSTYRLARTLCPRIAILAALLTAMGPNTLTFIAGGFQANSLALAIALLALSFRGNARATIVRYALLSMTALIHPWTFVMYLLTDIVWVSISRDTRSIKYLALAIAGFTILYIFDTKLSMNTPYKYLLQLILRGVNVSVVGQSLKDAVTVMTWGSMMNTPLFMMLPLALNTFNMITVLYALVAPLTLILNKTLVHRLLLNIPLTIIAAYGISKVRSKALTISIILSVLMYTLVNSLALTPLTTPPWTNIFSLNK